MNDLPVIIESTELPAAYQRLQSLPPNRREHALQRFEKLCSFQESDEQFGAVPATCRIDTRVILPFESVLLLNWLCVRPDEPIPPAYLRELVREQVWLEVEERFGYCREPA